jgi:pimeloyl-ACP methyl ester carboxylesterase
VTWGPQPWTLEEIRREAIEATDAWIRRSSFGRASVSGVVASWVEIDHLANDCAPIRLADQARAAVTGRGVDLRAYDRIAFLHPRGGCPWSGLAGTNELWLNGVLRSKVVIHELGHTWGLDHANALECTTDGCHGVEYGDPFSPMGRGDGDFTAFEKFRLGWITDVAAAETGEPASVRLGALERPSALPQAFVVQTDAGQFWLEYRAQTAGTTPGVLVHANATPTGRPMSAQPNLLVRDAGGPGRPVLAPGERFAAKGAFEIAVASVSDVAAGVEFAWTDTSPPPAPRVSVRSASGRVHVRWRGTDPSGSGLSYFEVALDGRGPRVDPDPLGLEQRLSFAAPAAGRHTVTVTAVDRAGNRGSAARPLTVAGSRVFRARVNVGGHRLYVECRGAGAPAVILDAGLNESGGSWSPVVPPLARKTRVCSYDRAGIGASEPRRAAGPATSRTMVEELRLLLRRARIAGPYVLAGHSFGGVNVRLYAARHPGEVAGIVFVDAADAEALGARGVGFDGSEPVDFAVGAAELRGTNLGSAPAIVLFSSARHESATSLARLSSNSSLVFVPRSGHHIHQERPGLVVEALVQVATAARTGSSLVPCRETALERLGGACLE